MAIEVLSSLLAALLSMVGWELLTSKFVEGLFRKFHRKPPRQPQQSYSEKLHRLTESLRSSSHEVDSVLAELADVARKRQEAAAQLEEQLLKLEEREQALQERVKVLENVPLPVAEYFASLTSAGEKRSARRDYMLFGAGVLVSTVISIAFFLLQG